MTTEEKRQYKRDWYKKWCLLNPEKIRAKSRRNYERHRKAIRAYGKEWYAKNKARVLAQAKEYHAKNTEHRKAVNKAWRDNNTQNYAFKSKKNKDTRARYAANRQKKLEANRNWRANNPGKWAALMAAYRARKRKASINTIGISAWMHRCRTAFESRCYYCDKIMPSWAVHFDHVVPLARGGLHAIGNLATACAGCNLSKQDKLFGEWEKEGQQVLAL